MYLRDYSSCSFGGKDAILQAHRRGPPTSADIIELKKSVPLHSLFSDWRSLLSLRTSHGDGFHRLFFRVGGGIVFSLDVLDDDETRTCEGQHQWCSDPYLTRCSGLTLKKSVNMIFFRPKDGTNRLFRFTVGQPDICCLRKWMHKTLGFGVKSVLSSFVELLLQSHDQFSTIVFVEQADQVDEEMLPGRDPPGYEDFRTLFRRRLNQFPRLPIRKVLQQSTTVEFIGVDFDKSSCSCFGSLPPNLKELKFHSCRFVDEGRALFDGLQESSSVENLELDLCPLLYVTLRNIDFHKLSLKSVTLGVSPFMNLECKETTIKSLCRDESNLKSLRLISHQRDYINWTVQAFDRFNGETQHQYVKKKLELVLDDRQPGGGRCWQISDLKTQKIVDECSIETMTIHLPWSIKGDHKTNFVNDGLQKKRLAAFNIATFRSRQSLLSNVIAADARIAGINRGMFSLLKDNVDVLAASIEETSERCKDIPSLDPSKPPIIPPQLSLSRTQGC